MRSFQPLHPRFCAPEPPWWESYTDTLVSKNTTQFGDPWSRVKTIGCSNNETFGDCGTAEAYCWAPHAPTRVVPSKPPRTCTARKTEQLARVHRALVDLGVEALISIGGDGTLMTANSLHLFQQTLPPQTPSGAHCPCTENHRQRLRGHRLHLRIFSQRSM